jgi:CRISPR-associated protein Cas5t
MEVFTIDITSWTASFRYPNLISGFQPTLEVPPISTILGLINAAAGSYQKYEELRIAYYFEYKGKDIDLETIYQIASNKGAPSNNVRSNVIRREFLSDTFLRIYVSEEKIVDFFHNPYYSLVLGRMNDLASVVKIEKRELYSTSKANKLRGQIIPFLKYNLPGQIQALPKYFTDTFPRNNIGTEAYSIINFKNNLQADIEVYHDEDKQVDLFFHNLNFPS